VVAFAVPFTKPLSKTQEVAKITVWVAVAQFANMAIIPLFTPVKDPNGNLIT